jgi:two-component system, sensor histidine kinase and response regulator
MVVLRLDQARRRSLAYILLALVVLIGAVPAHRSAWQGTAQLHTLLETVATLLGLVTGAMALLRYYTKKNSTFLLLGTGFLGAALLDGYHAAITSSFFAGRTPSVLSTLTPWSGVMSRVFMSLVLCASVAVWKREERRPTTGRISEILVYLVVAIFTIANFAFFALVRLPPPFNPHHVIHRVADLVPALGFGLAAAGYLWKGRWKSDDFEHWLVFALIVYAASHIGYMSFYSKVFDSQFMAAHGLKILGHIFVLTGLFTSSFSIFKSEVKGAADLVLANQSLAAQIAEREQIGEELRRAQERLEERVRSRTAELDRANQSLEAEIVVRSRTEESRRQSFELFTLLLDSIPEGVYGIDLQGHCTFCNPSFLRLLGFQDAGDVLGRNMHSLIHHTRADGTAYPLEECHIYEAFRCGRGTHIDNEVMWRSDGSSFPAEYWSHPMLRDGNIIGTVVTFVNITERKRAEDVLHNARQAAEAASRAKSEFLANMSHEIRTPLNGVIGMTDLALDSHPEAQQREYLETIKSSADSLLIVINDILDFSKIEAGKMDLETADFNLRNCLEEALRPMALRADENGVELLCDIAPDVPEIVQGDYTRLRQVVVNLVGNAIKFTPAGEVAVRLRMGDGDNDAGYVHFTVLDTGIGIAPDKREAIFSPFTQADTSTTRKYGGTGLGLTISGRLVSMMGGTIWVESEVGKGSQFHFTVQLKAAANGTASTSPIAGDTLRGTRVLIVDDNATNRRILHGLLEGWEIRASQVESGEDAMTELLSAQIAGDPHQLILTDMHMPNMDGFGLIEKIRNIPEISATAIMMLTSAGHREDVRRCTELGITSYLLKPIRKWELLAAMVNALGDGGFTVQPAAMARPKPEGSGRRLHILLAEDSQVNQTVATRTLEKMGHSVMVANNGREALSLVARHSFDLVLMDIQMPEMDGLTATNKIRERERQGESRTPIIALTAHAMKGDRERCLEGGMDGYVSKPILREELEEAIAQAMKGRIPVETVASHRPKSQKAPAEDSSGFDAARFLKRLGGDEKLLSEVLEIFLSETPKRMQELGRAISERESEAVERISHTLKGEVGYLGISEASEHARELETLGRTKDLEHAPRVFAAFESEISAILNSMRSVKAAKQEIGLAAEAGAGQ